MEGRFLVLAGQLAHEELAAEQLRVHEGAVLRQADLVRRELHPFCTHTQRAGLEHGIGYTHTTHTHTHQLQLKTTHP